MKTLIIDSATNILYTSLIIDDNLIYESYIQGKNDHAKAILVEIEKACFKGKIDLIHLDRIIVGVGPGSYTGVRMAVTVGKMIATMAKQVKLFSISTLLLMASGSKGVVYAGIDARRGNVFGCLYDMNTLSYLVEEALIEKTSLENQYFDISVDESHFTVDPFFVIKMARIVEEPKLLTPNYLRQTEAERTQNV